MEKKINVGFIIQCFEEKWREIEGCLSERADLIYVKKVPPETLLRIREVSMVEREKMREGGKSDYVKHGHFYRCNH